MEYAALHGQYHMEKTIGSGGFAKVKMATHLLTGEKVAIKIMLKQTLMEDLPRVKHEINALKSLSHTNICKLYQIVETSTHYFLIMEYCSGGELFDHIVEKEKLTENEARLFFQQIVSAVSYLHGQGFAHRDLKPENILLDKNHNLKLIDFGLSVKPENGLEACLYTSCGSPNYAAPELIRGEKYFGHEIDIWSLGVLLYALLCGCLPFEDESIQKLYEKILSGCYEEKWWLSSESKALLSSLLQVNARKRITTNKLKTHAWLKKDLGKKETGHSYPKIEKDFEILKLVSQHFNKAPDEIWDSIQNENYDYIMSTYLILLDKKRSNEPVILKNISTPRKRLLGTCLRQSFEKPKTIDETNDENNIVKRTDTFILKRGTENRASIRNDENRRSTRRNCKRIRSPGIRERNAPEAKRAKNNKTPVLKNHTASNEKTPCSAKRILVGLERSLNKAKVALTPRRRNHNTENAQPTVLCGKDLCNVSSTNSDSPEEILAQLQAALKEKGIVCTQKGFVLKGKLRQQSSDAAKKGTKDQEKLSFELEVCWIPSTTSMKNFTKCKSIDPPQQAVVGIRRRRLRGDSWIYKNICEEVLALTAPRRGKCC
ncbi:hypothetical protein RUM43_005593 [Polyplax serrata]|uniref:non-specific serine/threonine protein kinase n=1 Tax=Polyplax serrata TaxID=468196 RepID=A0AAN8S8P5_POLSC